MLPGLVSPYDTLLEKISAPSTFAATGWYDEKLLLSGDKCLIQHHRSPALAVGVTHIFHFFTQSSESLWSTVEVMHF